MASYNRVPYTDRERFDTDSEFQLYTDNLKNHNYEQQQSRFSDHFEVELHPGHKPEVKLLCCKCKNTKPVKIVMICALVVFCLAGVVVVVSVLIDKKSMSSSSSSAANVNQTTYPTPPTTDNSTQNLLTTTLDPYNKPSDYGLFAYGPDENGYISFDHTDHNTYMTYFNRLESKLNDYSSTKQMSDPSKYIRCADDMSSLLPGKVCMLTSFQFGSECQNLKMYGIQVARPCVLLVLKLENNFMPKAFNFTDPGTMYLKDKLEDRFSSTAVGISCEGKTDADKVLIGSRLYEGPIIDYNPRLGFPLYYFLKKDTEGYITPAVMVQFNTIPTRKTVTVQCTAWASNFNHGMPQNSAKYTAEYVFELK